MIAQNYIRILDRISSACCKSGRDDSSVTLITVSKYQPLELIKECYLAGARNFGENRAKEFEEKSNSFEAESLVWHFIGSLQTNKVKSIIHKADYIHSVDSFRLAVEIEKCAMKANKKQKIFLEYKTSSEMNKLGIVELIDLEKVVQFSAASKYLDPIGLMTMAPFTDDTAVIRNCFKNLRELRDSFVNQGYPVKELSMGMTNDFEIAIEEGATFIRIGTAIFSRNLY